MIKAFDTTIRGGAVLGPKRPHDAARHTHLAPLGIPQRRRIQRTCIRHGTILNATAPRHLARVVRRHRILWQKPGVCHSRLVQEHQPRPRQHVRHPRSHRDTHLISPEQYVALISARNHHRARHQRHHADDDPPDHRRHVQPHQPAHPRTLASPLVCFHMQPILGQIQTQAAMPLLDRQLTRRHPTPLHRLQHILAPTLQQRHARLRMTLDTRPMQWTAPLGIHPHHIRTSHDEQLDRVRVPLVRRPVQRRAPVRVRRVHVKVILHENVVQNLRLAILRRNVTQRVAL
mmetsp:Transcript_9786/g.26609  ORF Transcript_9786/g.26609 Transcript_9786/m.26609 type:complete len:288 (+) Transcript_9786:1466-2329(+)